MFRRHSRLTELSDNELVSRYRQSEDQQVLAVLYERHRKLMLRVASRVTRDAALAEDVVQEALFRAQRNLQSFDCESASSSFRSWILRICKHVAIDEVRKRKQFFEREVPVDPVDNELRVELSKEQVVLEEVLEYLGGLENPYRMCFLLFVVDGYSYNEIVNITGLKFDEVKTCIRTARRRLRKQFT